jgi:hypothetical protein
MKKSIIILNVLIALLLTSYKSQAQQAVEGGYYTAC